MSTEPTVPWSAASYVRGALHRALLDTLDAVEQCRELAADEDVAGAFRTSLSNAGEFQLQWAREACDEFAKLPPDLQPYALAEHVARAAELSRPRLVEP